MKEQKTSPKCVIARSGKSYDLDGLRKLAAALCKLETKFVDDSAHKCKVSPTEGIIRKNE
jgi:hypothetical protein